MPIEERKKLWRDARSPLMQQHFFLPELPPSVRLVYEPLSYENGLHIFDIFKDDDNDFVDPRFKSIEDTEDYMACMLEYAQFSSKRAAFDWLLKCRETGDYVGIFHLHDLSNAVFGGANQKVSVGYAIGKKYRGKGYARESMTHFPPFLFAHSNKTRLLVYTQKSNLNSIRLMKSLNWQQNDDKYVYSEEFSYFELTKTGTS